MAVSSGSGEVVETIGSAQCYGCHTTATPLWRKDDEGKIVCNACGLYYKLYNSVRPIRIKSDIIRKRSRYDARVPCTSLTEPTSASNIPSTPSEPPSQTQTQTQTQTPSASPSVSCRPPPPPSPSPILAPDNTTQPIASHRSSELMGALGETYAVCNPFPGLYHPGYLS
ncbi:glucocorticoid receptor-like (DNA-binding domain) [Rhizopogon vinicolor AM-OR11-026]|uniref:Glucocorticoid receptor-like (DNA-binding domain) n=1 Tax=Rhizopogon vinicolor AM-OR11-026 TaxID=1314800 RepID=A0A1B7MMY4_9AGAM|nr:glucocorticoid receptor-like (DNA-binding domain) [Rhizopogon vinicolor AM-OR11-026]